MAASPLHLSRAFATPWPGVFGTRITSARHFGRHWHATYGIGLLEHGAQHSASGRGPVQAHAGDLITTNPGEVHDGRPLGVDSRRWRMLYLEPEAMAAFAGDTAPAGLAITQPVFQDRPLREALCRLFQRLEHWNAGTAPLPGDAALLACEEAWTAVCGALLQRHATTRPEPEAHADLRRVRERLADEALAPPTLSALAEMVQLSRYQLLRRFEKAYGLPPHAWLLQQRAERARALILRGHRLADAAAQSGFADQSHMTREFARRFAITPGAWRQAARAPQ
jgi:AraC-like DNA-binding protein